MDTLRVLITDDEPGMRLGISRTLRGFHGSRARRHGRSRFHRGRSRFGREGIGEDRPGSPPDILLLDHKMPGISGVEVLDRVSGQGADMLTIMITAYASIETAVTATKRGAVRFPGEAFHPG